ncbi:hypothetical protein SEUCBS139899_007993 [Sporothrix eucalyptigena]
MKLLHILAFGLLSVEIVSASACRPGKKSSSSTVSSSSVSSTPSSSSSQLSGSPSSSGVSSSSYSLPSISSSISASSPVSSSSPVPSSSPSPTPSSSFSSVSSPSLAISSKPSSSSTLPLPAGCVSTQSAPNSAACTNMLKNPLFSYSATKSLYDWTKINSGAGHPLQAYNCGSASKPGDTVYCTCAYLYTNAGMGTAGVAQDLAFTVEEDYAFSIRYRTTGTEPSGGTLSCYLTSTDTNPAPPVTSVNLINNLSLGAPLSTDTWLFWQTTFTPATANWQLECLLTDTTASTAAVYLADAHVMPASCLN